MNETYGHRAHLASTWQALGKHLARCWHTLSCSMSLLRVWQEYGKEQARSRQGAGKSMLRVCLGHAGRIQAEFGENSRRIQGEFRLNSQRMHLLRYAACLLLLMVVGVGEMWGQSLPFEVTTAEDITNHSEKLYWMESVGATGFYAVPHSNNQNASTTNAPTLRALWYFMESGESEYYYIINKETGKYLKKTGKAGDNNTIQVADYDADNDVKFQFSFGTPSGVAEGNWVIYPKDDSENSKTGWLAKQSGNTQYNLWLKSSIYNNTPVGDLNSQWKIVAKNAVQWPQSGLPFVVSTSSDNRHYYRINHAQNTSFNISYDGSNYVTISNELDNKTAWYFKEAATDLNINNLKYYYIVNAPTGKYLKFTSTTINGKNQTNAFTLSDYSAGDADRFQFVVVNSYGGNAGYSIMPKLAMSKYDVNNNANSMVPASVTNNEQLDLRSDRNNNDAHWTFEAVWGNPVVTCDENGTITITGEDGANLYYTTDGSTVPTTENLLYNESSKPTVSEGITTIKVRAIANEKSPSGVVTQKIVYVPNQTFSSTYNGNTQVPIVEVNNTTISSDEFNVSYQQGGNDVLECKNAGIYTVEITDKDGGEYIVYGSGSFTISPKAVTITANDASKEYDGTALTESGFTTSALEAGDTHTFTVVMTAGSTITDVSSTPNVIATVDGIEMTTGTQIAVGNYLVTTANGTLTVGKKSIGQGALAAGFTISFDEGNNIILKDGDIPLYEYTDFDVGDDTTVGKYTSREIRGIGNYTGYFAFTNANVSFQTDANELEWSATFVAEPIGGGDADDTKGHALPDGMKAFIITDIDGDWAIPEQLTYIPEGVPVLLVSDKESGGFIVEDATPNEEQKINDTQKGANMLKVTTSTTHFDIKTIFLLYKNEFIYNMSGDLAAGKVYLNPPSGSSPAPSRLRIKKKDDTGIEDTHFLPLTSHLSDVWYTLDGRRLNGKPMERGLYINEGKKIFIK